LIAPLLVYVYIIAKGFVFVKAFEEKKSPIAGIFTCSAVPLETGGKLVPADANLEV